MRKKRKELVTILRLAKCVQVRTGLDSEKSLIAVETIFSAIKLALIEGKEVPIQDFGTFHCRITKARKWKINRTGEIKDVKRKVRICIRIRWQLQKYLQKLFGIIDEQSTETVTQIQQNSTESQLNTTEEVKS